MFDKKVLHIIDKLNIGGAEQVVVTLVNILNERGIDVALLSLLDRGDLCDEINKDVPQFFLNRTNKYSLRSLRKLYHLVNEFDIVHVHSRQNLRYVVLCKVIYFGSFPKIVFHDHTPYVEDRYIFKIIGSQIDAFVGVSNMNTNWAIKNINITNAYTLPNIIRKLKVKDVIPDKDIVVVGNVSSQKNYEFLIKLSSKLKDKIDVYYGGISGKEYFDSILSMKTDNVNFIYGEKNIQQRIKQYEMALHCAHAESGPLVLIEYLAQGIPFITYNTGEVVEQIKEDLPEFIVNSFDTEEWIIAIERMKKLIEEDIEGLKERMTIVFEKNYSEDKYFEKCIKIYNSL